MPDISYLKIRPQVEGIKRTTSHPFAELQVTSNFSFLRGASHPEELVTRAAELGYRAIAITDHNSLAGVVRAHRAAKLVDIKLIIGCRLELAYEGELAEGEFSTVSTLVYPKNRAGYGALCRLLTTGKRRATSGSCLLTIDDLLRHCSNLAVILLPPTLREIRSAESNLKELNFYSLLKRLREQELRPALAITRNYGISNHAQVQSLIYHARHLALPLVATNDVYYHIPERRILQDTLSCIRNGCTIENAGYHLFPNAERYLKPPAEMHRLFRDLPEAISRSIELSESIEFSMNELRYEYPNEVCPTYNTPTSYLRELCLTGAKERYPQGTPPKVAQLIEEELTLISELNYEKYFLTCYDIVKFARAQEILCQGRGAAANSVVCFLLGITSVDPDKIETLFARFISKERNEPPDIDIDFEHERREEVIQYIYRKYGRERAGLTAEVITYRHRSAVRDIGKALGLSLDLVTRLAKSIHHWCGHSIEAAQLMALGISPEDPTIQRTIDLTQQILGFPRHLSQHVGGFIISEQPLCETVPILNAAMAERTTIEWDKDDIEELGLLKIDILALGMLSCVRKALSYVNERRVASGEIALQMHSIPAEDPKVYEMISAADTIGVFQIESRAQMSMLPRLKPRCFYDLVIEVAIVRPGPIRGNMVHPYLKRRSGLEPCEFPDERVRAILGKTLGVPIFQEQAMRLAIVLAHFTPGEAEQLRRAMAAWKHNEGIIAKFKERIVSGMLTSGYSKEFAETCMNQIRGFSEYGFPESHAASFALIVYASAWLKCHYPAEFVAALLNSQPMGFYEPAQIVSDAKAHGISFSPIDINGSDWDLTLHFLEGSVSIRLGMRLIKGLQKNQSEIIIAERNTNGNFLSLEDLWERCAAKGIRRVTLSTLARADAFNSIGLNRREASWKIKALPIRLLPFDYSGWSRERISVELPKISPQLSMFEDYASIGLSLTSHPLHFLRSWLEERMVSPTVTLRQRFSKPINASVSVAGLVIIRQRPGTAKGFTFITIEDETGITNLVLNPDIFEAHRTIAMFGRVLLAHGKLERVGDVTYVNVRRLEEISTTNVENHPSPS